MAALPRRALRHRRDRGAGPERGRGDLGRPRAARRRARCRRDRPDARRRLARGPAAVLRRGAVPGDRRLWHAGRLGDRSRARRPAVRPRRRRARVHADGRRTPDRPRSRGRAREPRATAQRGRAARAAGRCARRASGSRRSRPGPSSAGPGSGSSAGATSSPSGACASIACHARWSRLAVARRCRSPIACARSRHRPRSSGATPSRSLPRRFPTPPSSSQGQAVELRLARGSASARVEEVRPDGG